MTLVFVAIAAIIGIVLGKIIFGGGNISSEDNVSGALDNSNSSVIDTNEQKIAQLTKQLNESSSQAKQIKEKYESLLNQSKEQIIQLNDKLKSAMNGGIDDVVNQQLKEVETLQKKNSELEQELQKVEELKSKIQSFESEIANIEKLKSKIKSLEEDNDDLEDDLDDAKKKLRKKEQECSELQIEMDKASREIKRFQEDLATANEQLEDKSKELALKMESLSFVKEILTAEKTKDASISKLYSKVDGIREYISEELKDVLGDIIDLNANVNEALFGNGLDRWAVTAKKSWISGKISVAFVGEFSAGKTSIVNRILSQDDPNVPRLPVSAKATTAIPTYISGGKGVYYQFVTPNNELKSISEGTFKKVTKEVLDQVEGVSALIQYFVMTYKNPNLDKMSILDTPGFNSNDKEDAERTIEVINECDALFWVFDVNAGTVNRSSIDLIKKHLTKPLYIVINKVDTKAKSEVDKVEQLIRKTLTDAKLKIQGFIRFSSRAPLSDIMNPIKSIQHDSDKENYIGTLLQALNVWQIEQNNDVRKSQKEADNIRRQSENLVQKYNNAMNVLARDCETVSSIPQYNSRWLREDDYRMSQEEYQEMIELLDQIKDQHTDNLCSLYNQQMEKVQEFENAWTNLEEEKDKWKRLSDCIKILQKKVNDLKKM